QQSHRECHPSHGGGTASLVVHRSSTGRVAQCSNLFPVAQLPAPRHQPAELSQRCPQPAAFDEDHPDPRTAACPVETSIGEHFLRRGFGCWPVVGMTMKKTYTDKQIGRASCRERVKNTE